MTKQGEKWVWAFGELACIIFGAVIGFGLRMLLSDEPSAIAWVVPISAGMLVCVKLLRWYHTDTAESDIFD